MRTIQNTKITKATAHIHIIIIITVLLQVYLKWLQNTASTFYADTSL